MTQIWTVAGLLTRTTEYLSGKGSTSPRLDAELLLAEALRVDRITLYTEHDRPLTEAELGTYRGLVARRASHEPVAYILGRAHFRYLTLEVTPEVLIPRPETEELVDAVLAWLEERPLLAIPAEPLAAESARAVPAPLIADVGTGSGAIALSLAREAGVRVLATDTSLGALDVAARNREALGLGALVTFKAADLLDGVSDGSLRVVVSNPPYVADEDYEILALDVRLHEPAAALRAGADGLDVYRRLVPQAGRALGPGGALFLEIGIGQAEAVAALARDTGFGDVTVLRDLSGRERIVRAVLPGAPRVGLALLTAPTPPAGAAATSEPAAGGADSGAGATGEGAADREADATAGGAADPEVVGKVGEALRALRGALKKGAIIGIPTDTVYGLAAAWDSPRGVRALFEAKGRGEERPVQVLFSAVAAVQAALPDLDPRALRVLEALLPGPYTFIVGTSVPRPALVGTADSLGVRVPDHPALLGLLAELAVPLAATSANRSGEVDATGVDDVDPGVLAACAVALVSAGGAVAARASTVVDLRPLVAGGEVVVLREGAVSADEAVACVRAALES